MRKQKSFLRMAAPLTDILHPLEEAISCIRDYAIFLLDVDGIVTTWNEGAERLKGYRAEEIIGQHFSKFYLPEEVTSGKCEYELKEATLTGRFEEEGWRLRKDGTRFWASVVITAFRGSSGNIAGFSKVTRDLTEKKQAEQLLRRANEGLEEKVALRTQELELAKKDLERAVTARDTFLSIASHELKTPITALSLQAHIIQKKMLSEIHQPPSPAKLEHALASILKQSERLTTLIEDLLDVSRVQTGNFPFQFESTDFSKLMERVLGEWEGGLRAVGCAVTSHIAPNVRGIADPARIEQVLVNLLSNVIKYAAGMPVQIDLFQEAQTVVIRVRDSGIGIDKSKLVKIFERFERATDSSKISGLGLGLFISRTIVEAHHGTIAVESKPGEGSTFTVRIPLKN